MSALINLLEKKLRYSCTQRKHQNFYDVHRATKRKKKKYEQLTLTVHLCIRSRALSHNSRGSLNATERRPALKSLETRHVVSMYKYDLSMIVRGIIFTVSVTGIISGHI